MNQKIVILSGAGISAESGLKTFRGAGGLWDGHKVEDVASPNAWQLNPELVLNFYNDRRRELLTAAPNKAHLALVQLEKAFDVSIVTQNVDDLHERAGSTKVLHLHGELLKSQSTLKESLIYDCNNDITIGEKCELGSQLRPFIVWFGEAVPMLDNAIAEVMEADKIIIIGTSLQVYPAAGLVSFAKRGCEIYYIDPLPANSSALDIAIDVSYIHGKASIELPKLVASLLQKKTN